MAKVICKTTDEIWYLHFGRPATDVFSCSPFNFSKVGEQLIDIRALNVKRYNGFYANEHHITTDSYYHIILPYINLHTKVFKFKYDDFELVKNFTSDMKHDVSYLKPKNDTHRFTISINGKTVARHVKFDALHNEKRIHKDNVSADSSSEYHRLFRGSHACNRIINETIDNDKKIFISGDSMCIPIIPILCCYFKEVVYMDNRDGKSHKDYYEGKTFDTVWLAFYDAGGTANRYLETNLM